MLLSIVAIISAILNCFFLILLFVQYVAMEEYKESADAWFEKYKNLYVDHETNQSETINQTHPHHD